MAIFQKAYRSYDGPLTPNFERILVIFRYALADAFKSRLFVAFFCASFLPSIALFCGIYVYHNLEFLLQFEGAPNPEDFMAIDGEFFYFLMQLPYTFTIFVLVAVTGPIMISPDIRNNAMSLYLSRPVGKTSYIVGKFLVLLVLGSLMSWIPGVLLILFQGYMAGDGWLLDNLHIPFAVMVSSLTWITGLSLLAFAISAFVQWKAMARLVFFGILFLGNALGTVIQELVGGWGGYAFDLVYSQAALQENLLQLTRGSYMPTEVALGIFLLVSVVSIGILVQRLRAFQVVS